MHMYTHIYSIHTHTHNIYTYLYIYIKMFKTLFLIMLHKPANKLKLCILW